MPRQKQGMPVILIFIAVLQAACLLESMRYFSPETLHAGSSKSLAEQLPDSTTVILDPGSSLAFGREWGSAGYSEVWLKGGGFFNATRRVDTAGLTIHLPQFDVVAYRGTVYCSNRKGVQYAWLKEGRASVVTNESKQKTLPLVPGILIEYTDKRLISRPAPAEPPATSPAD